MYASYNALPIDCVVVHPEAFRQVRYLPQPGLGLIKSPDFPTI